MNRFLFARRYDGIDMYQYAEPIKKGLQEMIFNLREAERLRKPQITQDHWRFNDNGKVIGYCNLGILRCMKQQVTKENEEEFMWGDILMRLYDLPYDFVKDRFLPYFPMNWRGDEREDEYGSEEDLETYIWKLNDDARLTFGQTADWLETTFSLD